MAEERKLATILFADLAGSTALPDARFRELGLDWHAAQTEQLRRLRKLALG